MGGQGPWEYEIGEEPPKRDNPLDMKESSVNVCFQLLLLCSIGRNEEKGKKERRKKRKKRKQ